ncbi:DUF5000 domain-containing lipoprotein [Flavivirga aquimarina]|uniref:DUF5000 domain-containing lipoprotein n=1 Tax=Flavivirga aquimarina TaxID=2027862 RepID=A0ABT8WA00_9FLAO|nr:DUF5000 domain-containing lipoprotein [Flavivirga aquimarina]MDO5969852.1 DUF5000 domain-containing lipoprotein [Flavivirga aquimarina]
MKNNIILLMLFGLLIYACDQETIGQQPIENDPPGIITNTKVENIAGGALIMFTPPKDEDFLYTKAVYYRKEGVKSESKASLYADTLKVVGYGDIEEHEVELFAVDRSRNESPGVKVTIKPLEPAIITIANSLEIIEDFGGITSTWVNENEAEISIVIKERTDEEELLPLETFYSKSKSGKFSIYGLDTIPRNFEAYIEDRWQNRSAIKEFVLTPFYETELDKALFSAVELPGDGPNHASWYMSNIWNGTPSPNGYSSLGGQGIWPQSITIDLGVLVRLSRIKVYQRIEKENYIFGEGNLKRFEVWGAETLDLTGNWDSWTLLGDFESIKPSELPFGQISEDDRFVATNGEDFSFLSSNPKVRYIRILVKESWAGGDNFQIMELDIFGDNR